MSGVSTTTVPILTVAATDARPLYVESANEVCVKEDECLTEVIVDDNLEPYGEYTL